MVHFGALSRVMAGVSITPLSGKVFPFRLRRSGPFAENAVAFTKPSSSTIVCGVETPHRPLPPARHSLPALGAKGGQRTSSGARQFKNFADFWQGQRSTGKCGGSGGAGQKPMAWAMSGGRYLCINAPSLNPPVPWNHLTADAPRLRFGR